MPKSYSSDELMAWAKFERGKPCGNHPQSLIKNGTWGNWCGNKDDLGRWCTGTSPTDEFLLNYRKEKNGQLSPKRL